MLDTIKAKIYIQKNPGEFSARMLADKLNCKISVIVGLLCELSKTGYVAKTGKKREKINGVGASSNIYIRIGDVITDTCITQHVVNDYPLDQYFTKDEVMKTSGLSYSQIDNGFKRMSKNNEIECVRTDSRTYEYKRLLKINTRMKRIKPPEKTANRQSFDLFHKFIMGGNPEIVRENLYY